MANYILLKDMPDAEAGSIFTPYKDGYSYMNFYRQNASIEAVFVEHNPEWFKEERLTAPDLQMNGRIIKIIWTDVDNEEHTIDFKT